MANKANALVLADLKTVGQARKLLSTASRFIAAGHDAVNDVFGERTFKAAARSSLDASARWVRDAQALLAGSDDLPLTAHQQSKAFYSYKQASETMKLVQDLASDGGSWVDDFQTACKQTVGAVAKAAGAIVGSAAELAGTAAGGLAGGFFKNLGFGAVGLVLVVGGILFIKAKARV